MAAEVARWKRPFPVLLLADDCGAVNPALRSNAAPRGGGAAGPDPTATSPVPWGIACYENAARRRPQRSRYRSATPTALPTSGIPLEGVVEGDCPLTPPHEGDDGQHAPREALTPEELAKRAMPTIAWVKKAPPTAPKRRSQSLHAKGSEDVTEKERPRVNSDPEQSSDDTDQDKQTKPTQPPKEKKRPPRPAVPVVHHPWNAGAGIRKSQPAQPPPPPQPAPAPTTRRKGGTPVLSADSYFFGLDEPINGWLPESGADDDMDIVATTQHSVPAALSPPLPPSSPVTKSPKAKAEPRERTSAKRFMRIENKKREALMEKSVNEPEQAARDEVLASVLEEITRFNEMDLPKHSVFVDDRIDLNSEADVEQRTPLELGASWPVPSWVTPMTPPSFPDTAARAETDKMLDFDQREGSASEAGDEFERPVHTDPMGESVESVGEPVDGKDDEEDEAPPKEEKVSVDEPPVVIRWVRPRPPWDM